MGIDIRDHGGSFSGTKGSAADGIELSAIIDIGETIQANDLVEILPSGKARKTVTEFGVPYLGTTPTLYTSPLLNVINNLRPMSIEVNETQGLVVAKSNSGTVGYHAVVFTVAADNSITYGTALRIDTNQYASNAGNLVNAGNNRFLLTDVYGGVLKCFILLVNGTTVTLENTVNIESLYVDNAAIIPATNKPGEFLLMYSFNNADSYKVKIKAIKVTSAGVFTTIQDSGYLYLGTTLVQSSRYCTIVPLKGDEYLFIYMPSASADDASNRVVRFTYSSTGIKVSSLFYTGNFNRPNTDHQSVNINDGVALFRGVQNSQEKNLVIAETSANTYYINDIINYGIMGSYNTTINMMYKENVIVGGTYSWNNTPQNGYTRAFLLKDVESFSNQPADIFGFDSRFEYPSISANIGMGAVGNKMLTVLTQGGVVKLFVSGILDFPFVDGVAKSGGVAGEQIKVLAKGELKGFTSLIPGRKYWYGTNGISLDGNIGYVGTAIDTSSMLVDIKKEIDIND